MAGFKATRGQKSHNWKRMLNGIEIKPCLYCGKNGKQLMAGSVDGEIVMDSDGMQYHIDQFNIHQLNSLYSSV